LPKRPNFYKTKQSDFVSTNQISKKPNKNDVFCFIDFGLFLIFGGGGVRFSVGVYINFGLRGKVFRRGLYKLWAAAARFCHRRTKKVQILFDKFQITHYNYFVMKRPKTYNLTFTVNSDGSTTVGEAFVLRKYNQYRREFQPLTKSQRNAALKNLVS